MICYVVTNDSIQESEFQFLKLLKEKAKPLIVLLNLKHNLRDSRRLEHFLKNPNKLFSLEGKSGIGGHIERIRRYAQQHYANDYFDIVPAMLLAAQLSNEPEHKERKEKLYKASRIQDFLDSIRESLIKHGAIRRSQTFLGSTVGAIESPYNWLTQQVEDYQQLTNTLENKRQTIQKEIEKARKDALEYLEQQIEETFKDAFNAIPSFAERYWDASEKAMNDGWKTKLDSIGFEKRLKNAYEKAGEKFKQEVEEILKELGKELQLISKLMGSSFKFNRQDSDTFLKHAFAIGGSILGLIGGVLVFSNPVGWAFIAAGTIFSITSNFFKSKADKRKEAVLKISVSLRKQLDDGKKTVLKKTKDEFKKYCDSSTNSINTYFEELIAGLNAITAQLQVAKSQLDNTANYLNRAYAKRIIDWGSEQYETLNNESINKTIAEVERDFGSSLKIQTLSKYQLKRSQDEIKHVLQEDIYVQSLK